MQVKTHYQSAALLLGLLSSPGNADSINTKAGFIDFNLYPYLNSVDSDSSATVNIAASLAHRFSYFSLTNFANQAGKSELEEFESFYTEQNIRWQISDKSPLDLTLQFNLRSGQDNDRQRLGFRWRLNDTQAFKATFDKIYLSYSINFHVLQLDNDDGHAWQMEHVYRLSFPQLNERLYLSGFIDHTLNQKSSANVPSDPIVMETQLGFRIVENLFAVTEYRSNQYREEDVNNLAVGFEYKIKW